LAASALAGDAAPSVVETVARRTRVAN